MTDPVELLRLPSIDDPNTVLIIRRSHRRGMPYVIDRETATSENGAVVFTDMQGLFALRDAINEIIRQDLAWLSKYASPQVSPTTYFRIYSTVPMSRAVMMHGAGSSNVAMHEATADTLFGIGESPEGYSYLAAWRGAAVMFIHRESDGLYTVDGFNGYHCVIVKTKRDEWFCGDFPTSPSLADLIRHIEDDYFQGKA